MVLSHEDNDGTNASWHPYWYGRIIGMYHTVVHFAGLDSHPDIEPGLRQMEFLHMRWFGHDYDYNSGWKAKRLPRIGFLDSNDDAAFGFVDPSYVVRSVHLMPAFAEGRSENLPPAFARYQSDIDKDGPNDWEYYHVGVYV